MLDMSRFREQFATAAAPERVTTLRCLEHDEELWAGTEPGVFFCPHTPCPVAVRFTVEEREPGDEEPAQEES